MDKEIIEEPHFPSACGLHPPLDKHDAGVRFVLRQDTFLMRFNCTLVPIDGNIDFLEAIPREIGTLGWH